MRFGTTLPWWGLAGLALIPVAVAWWSYTGLVVPLHPGRRVLLMLLRGTVLTLAILCLLEPVRVSPAVDTVDIVVPVLIDASRSMAVTDAGGERRIDAALNVVARDLLPTLARFRVEQWSFGERLARREGSIEPTERESDLASALRALREQYRDVPLGGIVIISDGGETSRADAAGSVQGQVPVFTVGVGEVNPTNDLEVVDVSGGDASISESSVDITVSVVNRGATSPFDVRLLENGQPIDIQRVEPDADGSAGRLTFSVQPPGGGAALYTAEIPAAAGELVVENNRRSVIVEPATRIRRLLTIEGAPAFEHSFIRRALASDIGLEVDAIVRKGLDAQGAATFVLQGESDRIATLISGFPADAASLGRYDAIVLANVEADTLSRTQLQMIADFVGERGGGLLVLGARSFDRQVLAGTPLEEVLPVHLTDRSQGLVDEPGARPPAFRVSATEAGLGHPVMRIGRDKMDSARRWLAFPALAGAATFGALRPGAQLLAVVAAADGVRPLIAAQRFGRGRALVFSGEATWRWRMQTPSADRSYELFWRQVARWLSSAASDPVALVLPSSPAPGGTYPVEVEVRDSAFRPVGDAALRLSVTSPAGAERFVPLSLSDSATGRYSGPVTFEAPGVYRLVATASRNGASLGSARGWTLAGGVDREMTDPRLNEDSLRRLSRTTGGQYVRAADVDRLRPRLEQSLPRPSPPRVEDVWDTAWVFAGIAALLSVEWVLRRAWGLR